MRIATLLAALHCADGAADRPALCAGRIVLAASGPVTSNFSMGERASLVVMVQQARRRCPDGRLEIVGQGPGAYREFGYGTTHVPRLRDSAAVSVALVSGTDVVDGRYGPMRAFRSILSDVTKANIPLSIVSFSFDKDYNDILSIAGPHACLRPRSPSSCHRLARLRSVTQPATSPSRDSGALH